MSRLSELNVFIGLNYVYVESHSLTRILRKAECEWRSEDLLLEEVLLVEEEDDGGVAEPLVVAYRVEQLQRLLHAILKQ